MKNLNVSLIRKRIIPIIPDDDMIQNCYVEHNAAILYLPGDLVVFCIKITPSVKSAYSKSCLIQAF